MLHYRLHHDPKSSHQQIVWLLNHLNHDPVLDVGAAQGFLGQLMQGTGRVIDAVEPNEYWAERARPYYRHVFASTIEQAHLASATYPVVVCADVLEHTADPVTVLKQLREVATADAVFVISLPNVTHVAVRLLLLAGQFPQMERGILDRTHLHFWTRATATAMLREAGLRVERVRPTGFPLDELWQQGADTLPFRLLMRLQHLLLLAAPTLFAWQWVFVARPLAQPCAHSRST
ncbi:MAG: class I SAM-dependent methyltransferase [Herpetosiphonaceae bacterium]|nr:class I SAM-dependent methyltransferase [Herpetosiphonaceae bacterium]